MTVTILRANIMLVVAYRQAALELIQIKHFQFKYKRVPLELYIIYCNLVLSLTVLYRNLLADSTYACIQNISTTYFTHTLTEKCQTLVCMRQVADIKWTSHRTQ